MTATDSDRPRDDAQQHVADLLDAFADLDTAGLARLDADQHDQQVQARQALHTYLTGLWEQAKVAGEDPANDPRYPSLAALRDLAGGLMANTSASRPG